MVNVKRITIIRGVTSTDQVSFLIEGPSPFPEMAASEPGEYLPYLNIEVRRGYAEEWLKAMGFDMSIVTLVES